jgi:hypothetical protein
MLFARLFQRGVMLCATLPLLWSTLAIGDPPVRTGRLSYVEGAVSFYADRDEGWRNAQLNYPVTSENSVWVDGPGYAEVTIGASALRLSGNAVLDFLVVDDVRTQLHLQRGSLSLRVRDYGMRDYQDSFAIDTPQGRFTIESGGRYRLDVSQDGLESRLVALSGRARFEGNDAPDNRLAVDGGRSLVISARDGVRNMRIENAAESALDRFADARDARWDVAHTQIVQEQIVSPYMTGYQDLADNGDWIDDGEYGRLWAPRVVISNWAPYRYGRWAYVRPWGWTWIDDAPWGFAPFHYGRWVFVRSRWCWWPGAYTRRPYYAPALVAWIGTPGIGISLSTGPSIGWFPLAPRENFIPRYTQNVTYIRNINYVTNNVTIINPPNRYRNQAPGATVVNHQVFRESRPVGTNTVVVGAPIIASEPVRQQNELPPARFNAGRNPIVQSEPVAAPRGPAITTTKPARLVPEPAPAVAQDQRVISGAPVIGGSTAGPRPQGNRTDPGNMMRPRDSGWQPPQVNTPLPTTTLPAPVYRAPSAPSQPAVSNASPAHAEGAPQVRVKPARDRESIDHRENAPIERRANPNENRGVEKKENAPRVQPEHERAGREEHGANPK